MKLYSTNSPSQIVSLKKAVLKGLPDDNGLYMPAHIPRLPDSFINNLTELTFKEISFQISKTLFQAAIPENDLLPLIEESINFPAPLVQLDNHTYILELFHGPSLAFKDFGARFMAQLMSYFNRGEHKELVILVATSGDTGGAVASGFYKVPGVRVVILYPRNKVSFLQEKQLTTLGHNITALEINGSFDDCQALVKKAFLDSELTTAIRLTSANSINIARLIPQSFYYFEAYKQLGKNPKNVVFSVPCGNFGNLTAGLFAQKMGLPVQKFLAATNVNDVVPQYLSTGAFNVKPSIRTISNAMDVGNPSNFARMLHLFKETDTSDTDCSTWNNMKKSICGYSFTDEQTELAIKAVFDKFGYTMDPHCAVGYLALNTFQKQFNSSSGIVLETAHPSKFLDDMQRILSTKVEVPERLAILADKTKTSIALDTDFNAFKAWLLESF